MKQPYVFHIQRYSIHDGPGIRTTVFFKGCPLTCRWCHNPESQRFAPEMMVFYDRCMACGACVGKCPNGANRLEDGRLIFDRAKCTACGVCTDWCIHQARSIAGRPYAIQELVKECEKDRPFYDESGGGITLSGGEVMCQDMDYIEELCRILHGKGYSIDIDTSGYAPYENFTRILPYTDAFLYDIKCAEEADHLRYTGVGSAVILENLKRLSEDGAKIFLRLPLIGNVNADPRFIRQVIALLQENHIQTAQIHLLPYHNTGRHKYGKLDRPYDEDGILAKPSSELLHELKNLWEQNGYPNIKIGG